MLPVMTIASAVFMEAIDGLKSSARLYDTV